MGDGTKSMDVPLRKKRRGRKRSKKGKGTATAWDFIPVESQRAKHANDCALPSRFVPLHAAEFLAEFEKIFEEHVPGFSGLGKRVKDKEKEEQMEWRVRLKKKKAKANPHRPGKKELAAARLQVIARYKALKKEKKAEQGRKNASTRRGY